MMENFLTKLTSRKFLAALAAEVAGLLALTAWADLGDPIAEGIVRVGTILGMLLLAIGYIKAEASIDAADVEATNRANGKLAEMEAERFRLEAKLADLGVFVDKDGELNTVHPPDDRGNPARIGPVSRQTE